MSETPEGRRLRLADAVAARERGSRVHIRVALADADGTHEGEAAGVGTETVELRLAAEATLAAIHAAIGAPRFRLLGIKLLHAFDEDVVLAVLRDLERDVAGRLIGAVPLRGRTLARGAAAALLDATNRLTSGTGPDGD
ncbi:MAG: hypothetical protein RRA92_00530 [Gemmatimonadota bacterium]|nr:hypothetical protein [Gemmatimonadota bacterium]